MLNNCTHCGSRTPADQKDYRRIRTRQLNAILISKFEKNLKNLKELSENYPNIKIDFPKRSLFEDIKFKIGIYKGLIKHKLDLY